MISFSLTQQIPGGKNQIGISTRHGKVTRFPNQRFVLWRKQAALEVLAQVKAKDKPLTGPLNMRVSYCPHDERRRDLSGMLDALFHLFEYTGLIEDDAQIIGLDWTPWKRGTTKNDATIVELG